MVQRTKEFAQIAGDAASRADATGSVDQAVWSALCDTGLSMAPFSPDFGGIGLSDPNQQTTLCAILRLIGGADLAVARLFEGHVNAVMLVSRYGTRPQIESLAGSVKQGGLSGVWGAEDAHGLRRLGDSASWLLEGKKILASGADVITRPLVSIGSTDGHVLYLLNLEAGKRADMSSWMPLGMKASASGTIDLTGVVVGPSEQIGGAGDYMRQPFFSGGAWRFCAAQLGAMEQLTKLYCAQLRARSRESDPYQLQRVAHCTVACRTTLFWVEEAARQFADESLKPAAIIAFTNFTRMVTERAALDVMECVQRGTGLSGLMRPNPIERICRDLATYLRQPVPDMAMSDAARAVLAGELCIGAPL